MKPLFPLLLMAGTLACPRGVAQPSVIAVAHSNTVYTGIRNVIHVAVSEHPVSKIQVKASIGLLEKTGTPGEYIWKICKTTGPASIKVYVIKKGVKTFVAEHFFRVHRVPDPDVSISRGHYSFAVTIAFGGPIAKSLDVEYEASWHIKSFDIELYRKKGDTLVLKNNARFFTEENRPYLSSLGDGDKFRLTNIVAYLDCDMERTNLSTPVYEIHNAKTTPAVTDSAKETQRLRR